MDNQSLQANGSCASKPQNKKILQANEDSVAMPQNKKILQESMDNSDTNLSKVFICHRLPERTFKIRNHYFPVCSRCAGIYIGAFSYYIFVYFVYVQYNIVVILAALENLRFSVFENLRFSTATTFGCCMPQTLVFEGFFLFFNGSMNYFFINSKYHYFQCYL